MDDYKLLGKDEVREIMGGCSDWSATLAERPRGEPGNVGNPVCFVN